MPRSTARASADFSNVEPILVTPSGGAEPLAAVAFSELTDIANDLRQEIGSKASPADLELAVASLFFDVPLTGGITNRRPGVDGRDYNFTRFEGNLVALTGSQLWATNRFNADALIDATGNQVESSYMFRITGAGTFVIEFQSATANPVIPDGLLTLVVQRRPVISNPMPPDWLAYYPSEIGNIFYQVYVGVDANGVVTFRNGNTITEDAWNPLNAGEKEALVGIRRNEAGVLVTV